jgi:hypothetical protein
MLDPRDQLAMSGWLVEMPRWGLKNLPLLLPGLGANNVSSWIQDIHGEIIDLHQVGSGSSAGVV